MVTVRRLIFATTLLATLSTAGETQIGIFSDNACQDVLFVLDLNYGSGETVLGPFQILNGGTWESAKFIGGDNAQFFGSCQRGFSCFGDNIVTEIVQSGECSGSPPDFQFDKILVTP
jgi:hypothetical protein